jgi:hypothetical protein
MTMSHREQERVKEISDISTRKELEDLLRREFKIPERRPVEIRCQGYPSGERSGRYKTRPAERYRTFEVQRSTSRDRLR